MDTTERRRQLGALLDRRRKTLLLRWRDVATQARVSEETLRNLRRGVGDPSGLTSAGVEQALSLAPGTIEAYLAGDTDTLTVQPAPPPPGQDLADWVQERMLAAGSTPREVTEFATGMGWRTPGRPAKPPADLTVPEWQRIADACGMTLWQTLEHWEMLPRHDGPPRSRLSSADPTPLRRRA